MLQGHKLISGVIIVIFPEISKESIRLGMAFLKQQPRWYRKLGHDCNLHVKFIETISTEKCLLKAVPHSNISYHLND